MRAKRFAFLVLIGLLALSNGAYAQASCALSGVNINAGDADLADWHKWHERGTCGQDVVIGIIAPDFPEREAVSDMADAGTFVVHPDQVWDRGTSNARSSELVLTLRAVAPGAAIRYYRLTDAGGFAIALDWMRGEGVHIIANVVSHPGFTETDAASAREAMANADGIVWLNSAGNYGRSYYEGTLDDSITGREGWHVFPGGDNGLLRIDSVDPGTVYVYVQWDDPAAELTAAGFRDSALTALPESDFSYTNDSLRRTGLFTYASDDQSPFYLALIDLNHADDGSPAFRLFVANGTLPDTFVMAGNSIPAPNDDPSALTVGAANMPDQPLASSAASSRGKPEISAPGGSLLADSSLWGSGFALMRVAGAAAVYWSGDPAQTAAQVRERLTASQTAGVFVPTTPQSELPVALIMVAAAGVIALGGGAVVLARRRRTAFPPPTPIPIVNAEGKHQLFISYSSKDRPFVLQFCAELKPKLTSYDMWIDVERIDPAEVWVDEIQRALNESVVLMLFASPNSLASEQVRAEWNYFMNTRRKPLLPLVCGGASWQDLPYHFHTLQILTYDEAQPDATIQSAAAALERTAKEHLSDKPA